MNSIFERRMLGRKYYSTSTIILMLEQVACGRSITEICEDPAFPCRASFYSWCAEDPDLQRRYEDAQASAKAKRNATV
jgi:hypothetical protein